MARHLARVAAVSIGDPDVESPPRSLMNAIESGLFDSKIRIGVIALVL